MPVAVKNKYLLFFIAFLFILYLLFFAFTVEPTIHLLKIKDRDFGAYCVALFLFSFILVLVHSCLKDASLPLRKKNFIYLSLGAGILFRVFCWMYPPFSTDSYRYLSDGTSLLEGRNPYATAATQEGVSYPHYRTIYPPLSQLFFVLGSLLSSDRNIFKVIFGLVEIAFLLWIYFSLFHRHILRKKTLSRERALLLLFLIWNPLSIFECHVEGHLDILPVFLFIYATFYIHTKKVGWYGKAVLGSVASFASKFQGGLLFPLLFLKIFRRKNTGHAPAKHIYLLWLLATISIVVLTLLPFYKVEITEGQSGIRQYFKSWFFSHSIFLILQNFLSIQEAIRVLQRIIIYGNMVILCLWFFGRLRIQQYILLSLALFIIFFPVQHPWYYLIGLYGVIFSKKYRLLWMLLLTSIGFNYLAYQNLESLLISFIPWINIAFFYALYFLFSHHNRLL